MHNNGKTWNKKSWTNKYLYTKRGMIQHRGDIEQREGERT